MNTFLKGVRESLEQGAIDAEISDDALQYLLEPKKVVEVTIPLRLDTGATRTVKAWRVQHNDALGPYKGGIRFAQEVEREEVEALAATMSVKNAALSLPYGGAKGGVRINPRELSTSEIERLSRAYVDAFFSILGPDRDVPAPDVNTNPTIMGYMFDEYAKLAGHTTPGAFTSKPLSLGGSGFRDQATGYGGYVVLRDALTSFGWEKEPKDTTVLVQGFGNVGAHIARILDNEGYKVVGVSDSRGGLYHKEGIDIKALLSSQSRAGSIEHNTCYPKSITDTTAATACRSVSTEDFLTLEADVLIPAALEGAITEKNANALQAKVVLEMANGGITAEAEELLSKAGIVIIPDVIANGGGVAMSYLEWVSNREGRLWKQEKEKLALDELLTSAFSKNSARAKESGITLRRAAYAVALSRMEEAMRARGWIT